MSSPVFIVHDLRVSAEQLAGLERPELLSAQLLLASAIALLEAALLPQISVVPHPDLALAA